MKQEEIVNEIRRMCGQMILMPSLGWHFKYNGQVYFYVNYRPGICKDIVPHIIKSLDFAVRFLKRIVRANQ